MRPIDADALYTDLVKMNDFGELSAKKAIRMVSKAPTVDAVPVRHGRWIPVEGDDMFCCCSECGTHEYKETIEVLHYDYCPYCGAKMDEESDNETG